MMTNIDESNVAELATALYDAFEHKKRDNGEEFYCLKNGSPEWMRDAIREAHDNADILPNDWIYDKCDSIASMMTDAEPDTWDDRLHEWPDGLVDVYNADRTAWLASHLAFGGIVDSAVEELGHSDQGIFGDIGYGQYEMIRSIASALVSAVQKQSEIGGE